MSAGRPAARLPDGLPDGVVPYRRTAIFDQDTMPEGLRREHRTRAGVWGVITVVEGRLRYRVAETETVLDPTVPGVVVPEVAHAVAPLGPARFFVEFYAAPGQE